MSITTHTIDTIHAREILDSSGNPTIEVQVTLKSGISAKASVPSGTSTGKHEAFELRDGDKKRYNGLGVQKACENVNTIIAQALKNMNVMRQTAIDQEMRDYDKSSNLHNLGANAILGVSLACGRAAAMASGESLYKYIHMLYREIAEDSTLEPSLPIPLFNIFNGGKHADTNLDFQEFMIIPYGVNKSLAEQVRAGAEIFHALKEILLTHHLDTDVGIEGGFAPNIENTTQAFDLIMKSIKHAGYKAGKQIMLGVDAGASELFDQNRDVYHFGSLDHDMHADQLISLYTDWAREYPLIYLEDGLHDDDWANWQTLTSEFKQLSDESIRKDMGVNFMVVADDLFVTQTQRFEVGVSQQIANSVMTKPNQVGTLTQTLEFIHMAQKNDYRTVVSHRSGETCDDFIADLAVAVGAEFIKTGSLSRGERLVKYNRLMEIEVELNKEL